MRLFWILKNSEAVRKAASDALFKIGSYQTKGQRAQWWASKDAVIVRHALLMSTPTDHKRVTQIASNQSHSLYQEAIRTMEFWEPPKFQNLIIQALDHQNPRVRETAARCLLWEQPVAAERKLLDLAQDADNDVAIAALDTLNYCCSREIILELDDLRRNGPQRMLDHYENSFRYVQEELRWAIPGADTKPKEKAYMIQWLKPIRHLLPKKRQEKSRKPDRPIVTEGQPAKDEITAQSIIDDLSEIDGMWYEKECRYWGVDWAAFNNHDRVLLKHFFEQQADPMVRELRSRASAAWQDADTILASLHDYEFSVLKASAYHSRFLKANKAIAKRLKELIEDPDVMNTFAKEALESYIHHVRSIDTYDWLVELAQHDSRPSIRYTAARELNLFETKDRLKELVPILDEPPINTWGVHCEILRGCERSWVSQSTVENLKSIDDYFLQKELASLLASD